MHCMIQKFTVFDFGIELIVIGPVANHGSVKKREGIEREKERNNALKKYAIRSVHHLLFI